MISVAARLSLPRMFDRCGIVVRALLRTAGAGDPLPITPITVSWRGSRRESRPADAVRPTGSPVAVRLRLFVRPDQVARHLPRDAAPVRGRRVASTPAPLAQLDHLMLE